ncbi:hypothetical protein Taro_010761 [Colocasia esculenta]|uniref:Uncharacterized protein n=1 Tax=Colocasia esculenta TaxID=4460 RepID=A0A843U475_COLES|nr:hypothetical protein [Colocasia esculenta]
MRISVRPGVETTREAPIWNQHIDPPTISPIPKFSGSSDSLDCANRWRSTHTEPACHGDRRSCTTRREVSSPVATPSITRITGGAHIRSRPFTVIGSRVQLVARSPPQPKNGA